MQSLLGFANFYWRFILTRTVQGCSKPISDGDTWYQIIGENTIRIQLSDSCLGKSSLPWTGPRAWRGEYKHLMMVQMQPKPDEEVVTVRQFLLKRKMQILDAELSLGAHLGSSSWGNIGKGLGIGRQTFSNLAHFILLKKTMEFANAFLNEHHGHHVTVTTSRSPWILWSPRHDHHTTVYQRT